MRLPRAFDGLAFRVGMLLTLALFPIGLIAVSLTRQVADAALRLEESAILALTAEAAAGEESSMRSGATAASALAAALPALRDRPEVCSAVFRAFVDSHPQFAFAGYIGPGGTIACGSDGVGRDVSGTPLFDRMRRSPAPGIDATARGLVRALPVILLTQPVLDAAGRFDGYVAVSLPNEQRFVRIEKAAADRPLSLITFNRLGMVLSADDSDPDLAGQLPVGHALIGFVDQPRRAFTGTTVAGEPRVFAVVPIIAGEVFALGSWPMRAVASTLSAVLWSPLMLVAVMWLVSLGVAYMAVHRLAIRNITDLRQRMRRFISGSLTEASRRSGPSKPIEFREIDRTWEDLAERVVRKEAELENIIHDRTVLLKELHHRVKNNLQMIASMLSMTLRKTRAPEAQTTLREVHLRVMSIATVHRALYTTSTVARVQGHELLAEIVGKTIDAWIQRGGAVRIETSYDPVPLYPDQAVPLSLLTSEAVINALKYVGRPAEGDPWIRIVLRREAADSAVVEVENSCGTPLVPPEQVRGTGLGMNLMAAFGQQLRGRVEVLSNQAGRHLVRVTFRIRAFDDSPVESHLAETNLSEPPDAGATAPADPAPG